ncbi:hypothetical protein LUZ63_002851 [Rhynchospora breviuscula]|uniref:Amino acid transporter transmembrane domain-containing protein n=1 Tax=Rhynchospora breviuscula TaxID=2022672 RepID=A0A9Q0D0L8_9POAL|nr:hypothetical protein LUZ63_002851 [Rhynchospora breviuscula]
MSREVNEIISHPATPRPEVRTPPVSTPPSQLHSPALRSPLPRSTPRTPRFMRTPLASPIRHAIVTMKGHLEELGHLTKLDPKDSWLPITESRNGNSYYAAFHTLSSGIGFQALVLPVAFTFLGWTWATICLTVTFVWQLYTLWLLVQMHEAVPGTRYSRYLHLAMSVFGPKMGKILTLFPILYLSAGICSAINIVGGSSMKLFFQIVCGSNCTSQPLTSIEWYLVFICLATVLAQLPNLNSIAGVSLIGGTTAVVYCTLIWVLSVSKGQVAGVSYDLVPAKSDLDRVLDILNALGIIAFAFRGHNLVLEIQSTMPSSLKHPSRVPMWKGVKVAYVIVALCLFPMAIGGFWAYGNKIPSSNGLLAALYAFHMNDIPRPVLGLTILLVIVNCLASFQIYAMPIFDTMEGAYVDKYNKPCPKWLRSGFRILFGGVGFLLAVAFPFLSSLGALIGAIALPLTLAYPSFMWISITKPKRYGASWYMNWFLGILGMGLSVVLTIGAVWSLIKQGVDLHFFKAAS